MEYSSTILVQPLYDIHDEIDKMYTKYGDKVFEYDDLTDPAENFAPKNAIINYYTNMVNHLNKYNILKSMLIYEKRRSCREISGLRMLLYIVIIVFAVVSFFMNLSGFLDVLNLFGEPFTYTDIVFKLYLMVIVIVISSIILSQVVEPLSRSYYNKYDVVYNTDVFNQSYPIKYLIDMMDIDTASIKQNKPNENATVNVAKSSNPMMMWWLTKIKSYNIKFDFNPEKTTNDIMQDVECEEKINEYNEYNKNNKDGVVDKAPPVPDACIKRSPGCLSNYTEDLFFDNKLTRENVLAYFSPCELNMYVKPFDTINKDQIHSTKYLLKSIQSYDKIYLGHTLNQAILYFKGFMLKEHDPDYQPPDTDGTAAINETISKLLKINYVFVNNLDLPFHIEYEKVVMNKFDAAKKCIEDDDYVAVVYKETAAGNMCYFIKKTDEIAFSYISPDAFVGDDYTAVFIKDGIQPVYIYSKDEPAIENINLLFQNNSKIVKDMTNFAYCVADKQGVCVKDLSENITAFESDVDIGYSAVFSMVNKRDSESLYKYKTSLNAIRNNNLSRNIRDTLITMKDYIRQGIVAHVVEKDTSILFRLEEMTLRDLLQPHFKDEYVSVSSIVADLISETNSELDTLSTANNADIFISYEKFVSKFSIMTQRTFVDDYLTHVDNVRFASKSLHTLSNIYDHKSDLERAKNKAIKAILYLTIIIGCIEVVRTIVGLLTTKFTKDMMELKPEYFPYGEDDLKKRSDYAWKHDNLWRSEWWSYFADATVLSAIIILIYLFTVAFLYSWSTKSYNVFNFNKLMSDTNGNSIKNSAHSLFDYYFNSVNKDKCFLIINEKINVHSLDDLKLDGIKEKASASKEDLIIINTRNSDMNLQYAELKNILTNYDKCSYLIGGSIDNVPFPTLDFTMYLILLIVAVVVVFYLLVIINPFKRLKEIKILLYLKDRVKNNKILSKTDTDALFLDADIVDNNVSTTIKYMWAILIVIAGIFLFILMYSSSKAFNNSLYGSDLFIDNQCYTVF